MTTELVCIVCPRGCRLTAVQSEAGGEPVISGEGCARGPAWAKQELLNPVRVLTALLFPAGAEKPVSVKTDKPVPKEKLLACAKEISRNHPPLPIRRGDVLIRDLLGTGSNVIATRDAE